MTADKPDHAPEGKRECRPRPSLPCSGQAVLGEQILRGKSETVVSPLCGSQRRVLLRWARALNATKRSWLSAPKISCARCKVSSRVLQRKSSELAWRETSGQCAPQNARPPRNKESRPGGHWAPAAARPSGRLGLLRGCAWSFSRLMLERNCEHRGGMEGYANSAGQRHTRTGKEGRASSVEAPQVCGRGGCCRAWLNCS